MQFTIANHMRRRNPYAGFRTPKDFEALALFKAGAVLHTWRVTSPPNWWLQVSKRKHVEIANGNQSEGWGYTYGLHWSLAALGKSQGASEERVLRGTMLGGLRWGEPESETWTFDAQRTALMERQWAEVTEGLRQREARGPVEPDLTALSKLSPAALALLRLLKAKGPKYPYPETFEGFQELEVAGLVRLCPDTLCFESVPGLLSVPMPRGTRADFKFTNPHQAIEVPA